MFPILLFAGLAGFLSWVVRPKTTGVVSGEEPATNKRLPAYRDAREPEGFMGPPLTPQEERLLSLLVLWVRDKKNPLGRKQYMTPQLAEELLRLCLLKGMRQTARAVVRDAPVPANENFGRRGVTVRNAILSYGTGGRMKVS
jgi:hypothetical protein